MFQLRDENIFHLTNYENMLNYHSQTMTIMLTQTMTIMLTQIMTIMLN